MAEDTAPEPEVPAPATSDVESSPRQAKTPLFFPSPTGSAMAIDEPPPRKEVPSRDTFVLKPGMLSSKTSAALDHASFARALAASRAHAAASSSRVRSAKGTVYVLVPSPPAYVKRWKARQAGLKQSTGRVLAPGMSSVQAFCAGGADWALSNTAIPESKGLLLQRAFPSFHN